VNPSAVHCTSSFMLLFRLAFPGDEPFDVRMALQPNHELIRSDAKIEYIDHDGEVVRTEPIIRQDHKIFKGEAYVRDEVTRQWRGCGWSRITILQDGDVPLFEGTFLKDEDVYHIKMLSTYMSHKEIDDAEVNGEVDDTMVVYRDSDRFISQTQQLVQRSIEGVVSADETNMSICAHDRLEFNMQPRKRDNKAIGFDFFGRLVRRQSGGDISGNIGSITQSQLASTIGDTNGCPQTREVALVAAAADCSYVTRFGNSSSTRTNIISIYNSASAVYESQLNITLGLSNIVMSDQECPTTASTSAAWNVACPSDFDMDNDLSTFSAWRGQRGNDGVALWTLLTGCSGGAEVGVAWLGMLCQYTAQTQGNTSVSGTNVVGATSSEWQVLAHELGHGFGAYHDCTSQTCGTTQTCCPLTTTTCDANQQYIMNPTTMDATNRFSLCTIGNICSGFADKTVTSTCLTTNNNVTLITAGECGNGIVEAGEECDCGGVQGCNGDPCCDPTTCKFTTGSVCDDSNDACCQSCQFAPSSKVCRTSINTLCDPVEYCPGNSSSCPPDVTTPDGTSCGSGLTCASGSCTSRDSQCEQAINGSTGSCDDSSCVLSCSSATYGPNTCLVINQNFIDGTQCGFGLTGTCQNGQCEGQSTAAAIGNWIQQVPYLICSKN
jgi:Metallo-peptidase family M12/Disintegrin